MNRALRYESASARFDGKLSQVIAEQGRSRASPGTIPPPSADRLDTARAHADWFAHAGIEVTHHVLANVAPFELVAARMCSAANDQAKGGITSVGPVGTEAFAAFKYLPGPFQQMALQLLASLATAVAPSIAEWQRDKKSKTEVQPAGSGKLRASLLADIRTHAPTVRRDVLLAGLSELIVEVVGWLTREMKAICNRLLRAIRHAMFPALKGIRVLLFREEGLGRREATHLALRLFAQAGIVAGCITAEHELHRMLLPFFGVYANAVSVVCMAVLCWAACDQAASALDRIDPAGARRQRELRTMLQHSKERRAHNERRVKELLAKVRGASRYP